MPDHNTQPDDRPATLSHFYTLGNRHTRASESLHPGDYGAMPHYQRQIRHHLNRAIEEERRTLDWAIPNRTTDQALADRWEYLRRRPASLESQSHIGTQRRESAFHLVCLSALLFALYRITNAPVEYPLFGHLLAWLMLWASAFALFQLARGFLSGISHWPGLSGLAQYLDVRMGDAPEVIIPTRSGRAFRLLKPVIQDKALSFRLPFIVRTTTVLPVHEVNVRLSAIGHLQVREAERIADRPNYLK